MVGSYEHPDGDRAFLWRDGVHVTFDEPALLEPPPEVYIVAATTIAEDGSIAAAAQRPYQFGIPRPVLLERNPCAGSFAVYGEACEGSGGHEPMLAGFGCPEAGQELLIAIQKGLGGSSGALAVGSGSSSAPLTPFCDLQVLPLLPLFVPLSLEGVGAGEGSAKIAVSLPPGTPSFDVYVQALFLDPGAPGGVSSSRALHVHGG